MTTTADMGSLLKQTDVWKARKSNFPDSIRVPRQAAVKTLPLIDKVAPFSEATAILDIACGDGEIFKALCGADYAIPQSAVLHGVDIAPAMLDEIRKLINTPEPGLWSQVHVSEEDARKLSSADNSYFHVISQLGIYLVPEHVIALREAHRVLAPGGVFAMSTIAKGEWNNVVVDAIAHIRPERHLNLMEDWWRDQDLLRAEIQKGGFEDVAIHQLPLSMAYENATQIAQLLFDVNPFIKDIVDGLSDEEIEEVKRKTAENIAAKFGDGYLPGVANLAISKK